MKTFVIGDIHGKHKALLECLKISGFDRNHDRLICLGDICDRGTQVPECINEVMKLPHCIYILGNHDELVLQWYTTGTTRTEWLTQGGSLTKASYKNGMPQTHIDFLLKAPLYFIDNNRIFLHGGFNPNEAIEKQSSDVIVWDRSLLLAAHEKNTYEPDYKFSTYDEIYLGHTPTLKFGTDKPQKFCNVWDLDTGAGWGAKLTIMDVNTKEYWQSGKV